MACSSPSFFRADAQTAGLMICRHRPASIGQAVSRVSNKKRAGPEPSALLKSLERPSVEAEDQSDHFRSFEVRSKEIVPTIACWP
jgi:hypothetical protein